MTDPEDSDRRHAEMMAKRKQVQDAEVASKTIASAVFDISERR